MNTLLFRDGRVVGTSTDAAVLDDLTFERPVIVGDGGAARAFAAAMPSAKVFSRRSEWPPEVAEADVVVHATPVRDEVLFELARRANAGRASLPGHRDGSRRRATPARRSSTGSRCSFAQGAASFELWTGVSAPLDVMRNAVRSAP